MKRTITLERKNGEWTDRSLEADLLEEMGGLYADAIRKWADEHESRSDYGQGMDAGIAIGYGCAAKRLAERLLDAGSLEIVLAPRPWDKRLAEVLP